MAETERDFFVTGLRNAHAMEMQARELMERQIDRTQDYPELRTRLQQHLVETTSQLERLGKCSEGNGRKFIDVEGHCSFDDGQFLGDDARRIVR